jgi:hypothetical protein
MNVAGAVPNGLGEDQVDHLDDRRLTRHLGEVREVGGVVDLCCRPRLLARNSGEDFFEEVLFDAFLDEIRVSHHGPDRTVGEYSQIVDGGKRGNRADRYHQGGSVEMQRKHLVLEGKLAGGEGHSRFLRLDDLQIDSL